MSDNREPLFHQPFTMEFSKACDDNDCLGMVGFRNVRIRQHSGIVLAHVSNVLS